MRPSAKSALHLSANVVGLARMPIITFEQITFPSVPDYVEFQLLATPMAALLGDRTEEDRQAAIKAMPPRL